MIISRKILALILFLPPTVAFGAETEPAEKPPVAAFESCLATAKETLESRQCFFDEVDRRKDELARYLAASKANGDPTLIDKSQQAWLAYREAQCAAVFDRWKDGSVRFAEQAACEIDLTADRTHDLWRDFLNYADRSPPDLPEPRRSTARGSMHS